MEFSEKPIMSRQQFESVVKQLERKKTTLCGKRFFDLIFALFLIILLWPIMLIVSTFILLESGKPVLFRQARMGKDGTIFTIYKFRTMTNDSATADGITIAGDKRITRLGKILRKYRLDELPQLFNIITGEMSFVGPRPDLPRYYKMNDYSHKCILLVRPGVTGPATLEFKDEDELLSLTDNPESVYCEHIFPQKVKLNIDYIQKISFISDLKIVAETFWIVFVK